MDYYSQFLSIVDKPSGFMVCDLMQIKDGIHWVGILHPEARKFDIELVTERGTTYNSYLIKGEKTVVIDTVRVAFKEEFLSKIKALVDPETIDYVVINHCEPDHSGSLNALLKIAPNAKVVCTKPAKRFLKGILNRPFDAIEVSEDVPLELGRGKTLKFLITPFLHWPDTMVTYLVQDKLLFSCDAFGAHYSDERLFNDLVEDYRYEFHYYFDRIVRPFKKYVLEAIQKIKDANWDIEMICPSHGPILRHNPEKYVKLYEEWSTTSEHPSGLKKVVVFYTSAHGCTQKLVHAVVKGLNSEKNVRTLIFNLEDYNEEIIRNELESANGILIGTPTIASDAPKPIWNFLSLFHTVAINRAKTRTSVFGAYGWSGEAIKMVEDRLKSLRLRVIESNIRINFVPTATDLAQCEEFGKEFARTIADL